LEWLIVIATVIGFILWINRKPPQVDDAGSEFIPEQRKSYADKTADWSGQIRTSDPLPDDLGLTNLVSMDRVPTGPIVAIDYCDASGRRTSRLIAIQTRSKETFEAFCFGRLANRHFRSDRVECWYDPDTGEAWGTFREATVGGRGLRSRLMEIRRASR
jgi:hypothetical protein